MRKGPGRIVSMLTVSAIAFFSMTAGSCDDEPTSAPQTGDDLSRALEGHYRFETDATDSGPHGRHGTLLGGATASGSLMTGANKSDALSLPRVLLDGLDDFSIAGWVRMDTFHIWPSQWISGATATQDNNLGIWYDANNDRWSMCLFGETTAFPSNSVFEDTDWHHIVVTRQGTSASLYVDGSRVMSPVTVSGDALGVDEGGFIVGQDQDELGGGFSADNSLAGEVDELRIYSRAITASEVAALEELGR